ncbi:MAG: hypothetical protein ACI3YK_02380 [Eubacteriales bacterium]
MIRRRLKKSTKKEEEAFAERMESEKTGFKDTLAILLAAGLTVVLPCLLVLLVLAFLIFLIFGAL